MYYLAGANPLPTMQCLIFLITAIYMGQWTKFAISIIPYSTIFPIVMIII
jgi:hypothetical protein